MGIDDERDRYSLEYHGLKCLILRDYFMKHLCGYVKVPDTSINWMNEDIDVHGGVTFDNELGEEEPGHWVGFDCAHAGDKVPGMSVFINDSSNNPDVYRDVDYVKRELERLAEQIAIRLLQSILRPSPERIIVNVKRIFREPTTRIEELEVNGEGRDRKVPTFLQSRRSEKDKPWGIEL